MASLLQAIVDPKRNWFARQHMKAVSTRLRKYGLRYDDLYDPYYDVDIKEALNRLPKEVVDARHARLKRAIDLSMKHEYLPEDLQAMQTPFRSYLQEMLTFVGKKIQTWVGCWLLSYIISDAFGLCCTGTPFLDRVP
ncbi:cytochrome b-c1 complex subunit 7-2-like protein, partial [Trifolium pratense]